MTLRCAARPFRPHPILLWSLRRTGRSRRTWPWCPPCLRYRARAPSPRGAGFFGGWPHRRPGKPRMTSRHARSSLPRPHPLANPPSHSLQADESQEANMAVVPAVSQGTPSSRGAELWKTLYDAAPRCSARPHPCPPAVHVGSGGHGHGDRGVSGRSLPRRTCRASGGRAPSPPPRRRKGDVV